MEGFAKDRVDVAKNSKAIPRRTVLGWGPGGKRSRIHIQFYQYLC